MNTFTKIIPFPVRAMAIERFDAAVYPRFAIAFGDRGADGRSAPANPVPSPGAGSPRGTRPRQ